MTRSLSHADTQQIYVGYYLIQVFPLQGKAFTDSPMQIHK